MTIDDIRHALSDRRLKLVSAATGISMTTLREIRSGRRTVTRSDTLALLVDYLKRKP